MARKCGFFDCNNQVKEGSSCQSCEERKEQKICSACRQPEPQEFKTLTLHLLLTGKKYLYKIATIVRDKLPIQLQTEFDQLLPQLKLTTSEQKLITEIEKFISDFLAEKGGKQDHIDWLLFCSVCNPEFNSRGKNAFEKNSQNKTLMESIEEKEKKLVNFLEHKVDKAISNKIEEEAKEEFYKQIAANPNDNQQPNQSGNNSAKIAQLQQENKLREKENEVDKLKKNNFSSNNQFSKNGNSNLLFYLGLGIMGAIIIFLITSLILQKKKKVYAYHK